MSHRGSEDLETCQAIISQILSLSDRQPYLISTTIQLGELQFSKSTQDTDVLMHQVWNQYEQVHDILCSLITTDADGLSEPISPISFEFIDIDDVDDRTATVHSISQFHPRTLSQFERLMDEEFQPVIDQLPGSSVISVTARPIIREE